MFSKILTQKSTTDYSAQIEKLHIVLEQSDAVIIGAGAGLSTSAGLSYSGSRFNEHFHDFQEKYGIQDMYSGGFYPFQSLEEYWAWWSRHIYWNRYVNAPKAVYQDLFSLVKGKDYFVLTTNVDHQFQRAGFDKERLFYTQGDYGLWQCSVPCHQKTYDNEEIVQRMVNEQQDMRVPSELIPRCPKCGRPMTMNLRCDGSFVQDEGWYLARSRYESFLRRHHNQKIVFLELGVGGNTPVIIKYPFWTMTAQNHQAIYSTINIDETVCPPQIKHQAIYLNADIGHAIKDLRKIS